MQFSYLTKASLHAVAAMRSEDLIRSRFERFVNVVPSIVFCTVADDTIQENSGRVRQIGVDEHCGGFSFVQVAPAPNREGKRFVQFHVEVSSCERDREHP